jgi:hypothetical protein
MYRNAKLDEQNCKSVGSYSWSSMLALAGLAVQLANKELRQLIQGNHPNTNDETRESAMARAKANQRDCYQMLTDIKEQANGLRKTNLKLRIKDVASKHHTTHESALKAILRRERGAVMYPILQTHIGGRVSSTLDEVWTPENAANLA